MSAAVDDLICCAISAWSASAVRGPAWCLRQIEDDYKAEMREAIHVLHNAGSMDITNDGDIVRLIEGRRR